MHPNLSPHLHTPECNEKIQALLRCRLQHPLKQYLGICTPFDNEMLACFTKERQNQMKKNLQLSVERRKRDRKWSAGEWDWKAEQEKK